MIAPTPTPPQLVLFLLLESHRWGFLKRLHLELNIITVIPLYVLVAVAGTIYKSGRTNADVFEFAQNQNKAEGRQ